MNRFQTSVLILFAALVGGLLMRPTPVEAHCQIPCGIYDDPMRVKLMLEDVETIKKAYAEIKTLTTQDNSQARNQMVRWVMNKEGHAQNIIDTISDYFLTQRVKPSQEDYADRLVKHHAVILAAMKAKQSGEASAAAPLEAAVKALESYYPAPKHDHGHDH